MGADGEPPAGGRAVHGTARGHAAVRATHAKTLELVREAEIGRAATCVVAVGAQLDERAAASLRGRVELAIEAGGRREVVRGRLNPAFRPGDPLVVRCASALTRDALVVGADGGAAALDRGLVRELARPGARVRVTLAELAEPAPGVLVVDPGTPWSEGRAGAGLAAELELASPLDRDASERALAALGRGERVALRAALARDDAAVALVAAAHDAGHSVLPAPGLAPLAAALAVAGVPARRVELAARRARPARLEPGTCRVALDVPGDGIARWLGGADRGLVTLDPGTPREQHLPWRAGSQLEVPGGARRRALVVAAAAAAPPGALDPAVATLARALLARGASARDVARTVAEATGLARRDAYDAVLALAEREV